MSSPRFQNLPVRAAVAFIAIPLIVFLAFKGGYYFFFLVALISSLSLYEFYKLAEIKGAYPLKTIGIIAGLIVNSAFIYERLQVEVYQYFERFGVHLSMFSQNQFLFIVLLKFFLIILLIELFRTKGSPFINISVTVLGVVIIALFFGTLIALRELFPYGFPVHKFFQVGFANEEQLEQIHRWGGWTLFALFASIWICDTAAFFGGITLGKHKLFESVSPKKTWEGAVFGFVFSIITMVIVAYWKLEYLAIHHAVILGAIIGIFGQLGDLVESRFKRDVGVKDSSSIIPGHGGVYDRFDSLVFLAPIVYLYIDFIVLS